MIYFDISTFDVGIFDTADPVVTPGTGRVQFLNEPSWSLDRTTLRGKSRYKKAGEFSGSYK